ncbi:hypothetical protein G1C97_0457 [Bifidobacterium sp. DSM 109959]|uniref:Uncharacterized protein n=1 Tax=Bifidobacterium olomucense TaxID=2675324 RepID=A0A7Y0EW52_9BIFI|nr:hypothetical protein [Bifidobacterium sp. DSM 109959]
MARTSSYVTENSSRTPDPKKRENDRQTPGPAETSQKQAKNQGTAGSEDSEKHATQRSRPHAQSTCFIGNYEPITPRRGRQSPDYKERTSTTRAARGSTTASRTGAWMSNTQPQAEQQPGRRTGAPILTPSRHSAKKHTAIHAPRGPAWFPLTRTRQRSRETGKRRHTLLHTACSTDHQYRGRNTLRAPGALQPILGTRTSVTMTKPASTIGARGVVSSEADRPTP